MICQVNDTRSLVLGRPTADHQGCLGLRSSEGWAVWIAAGTRSLVPGLPTTDRHQGYLGLRSSEGWPVWIAAGTRSLVTGRPTTDRHQGYLGLRSSEGSPVWIAAGTRSPVPGRPSKNRRQGCPSSELCPVVVSPSFNCLPARMSFCWHRRLFKPCWVRVAFSNFHGIPHGVRVADGPLLVWWIFACLESWP